MMITVQRDHYRLKVSANGVASVSLLRVGEVSHLRSDGIGTGSDGMLTPGSGHAGQNNMIFDFGRCGRSVSME